VEKYYQENMQQIHQSPMWEQFDSPMRAALRYRARERATIKAKKEGGHGS